MDVLRKASYVTFFHGGFVVIHIFLTVVAYLLFNIAIWLSIGDGGIIAIGGANVLGAAITGVYYRTQIKEQGKQPNWFIALLGSLGILLIVMGLRGSHAALPVSLSMEAVYNGFAVLSWPMFLLLHIWWPKSFTERPGHFDALCHLLMGTLVFMRFVTYGEYQVTVWTVVWIAVAIAGYVLFNISIKLAGGKRITNITMNVGGGLILILYALVIGDIGSWNWSAAYVGGFFLGGIAIFGIVRELGASYGYFGSKKMASVVAPLVYDGILVGSPLVMLFTREVPDQWSSIIPIAFGMLMMALIRYRHHVTVRAIA